jgi:ketosteroid isomerase-like protein
MSEKSHTDDVRAISALIERWAHAVRREDLAAILVDHAADILMFDVLPPLSVARFGCVRGNVAAFFLKCRKTGYLQL